MPELSIAPTPRQEPAPTEEIATAEPQTAEEKQWNELLERFAVWARAVGLDETQKELDRLESTRNQDCRPKAA